MIPQQKITRIDKFLLVYNIICLAYLLILGYYNRPTIDDFEYFRGIPGRGPIDSIGFFYTHINGRFLPNFITTILFILYDYVHTLLFITIFTIAAYYWIINKIIKKRLHQYIAKPFTSLQRTNLILFFISTFIIYNFEINTFTWTIASVIYFGSIFFVLLLFYCLTGNTDSPQKTTAIIASCLYIGCSNESLAVNIDLILIVFMLYNFSRNKRSLQQNVLSKKVILSIIVISISFLILYLSPANQIKLSKIPSGEAHKLPLSLSEIFPASLRSYLLLWKYILFKIPLLILIIIIFTYFINISRLKQIVIFSAKNILAVLVLFWLLMLPTTYAINYTPYRVLTPVWLLFMLVCAAIAARLKFNKFIIIAGTFLLCVSITFKIFTEMPAIKKYTTAYDERIKFLKEHAAHDLNPVVIDSLPDITFYRYSGHLLQFAARYIHLPKSAYYLQKIPFDNPFVYSPYRDAEISTDAADWKNIQFKNGLQLNFPVSVK